MRLSQEEALEIRNRAIRDHEEAEREKLREQGAAEARAEVREAINRIKERRKPVPCSPVALVLEELGLVIDIEALSDSGDRD